MAFLFERIEAKKRSLMEKLRQKATETTSVEEIGTLPEERAKARREAEAARESAQIIRETYAKLGLEIPDLIAELPDRKQKEEGVKPTKNVPVQKAEKPAVTEPTKSALFNWKLTESNGENRMRNGKKIAGILEFENNKISLGETELKMLSLLASDPGRSFTSSELAIHVYGNDLSISRNKLASVKNTINSKAKTELIGKGEPHGFVFNGRAQQNETRETTTTTHTNNRTHEIQYRQKTTSEIPQIDYSEQDVLSIVGCTRPELNKITRNHLILGVHAYLVLDESGQRERKITSEGLDIVKKAYENMKLSRVSSQ